MKPTKHLISLRTLSVAMCSLMLAVPSVLAADDEGEAKEGYFEEVTVTVDRTEKNVLDTAMTVTAFSSDMLQDLGLQDRDKLQNLVPGLQFGDQMDQGGNGVTLRGVGTRLAGMNHMDRAVAQYIDGAYTIGVYGTMPGGGFDLETIEVARGPQGTLNGRNSMAGSINFVYKKPSQEWDAVIEAEVTDVSQQRLNVAFGGPLNDSFSFRLTAGTHQGDGRQENLGVGPDYDAPDHIFYAPQLRLQNDRLDMNVRYSKVEDTGTSATLVQLMRADRSNPTMTDNNGSYYGPPPPNPTTVTNYRYLYESPVPGISDNCPVGMPAMRCGDIENKVAYNFPNYEDSSAERINAYISYDVSDQLNVRYIYSDADSSQYIVKEYDYTNRVRSADDLLLASDGNVPYRNRFGELPYDYEETSHELLFTINPNEQMSIVAGAFMYENKTRWAVIRNENTNWWVGRTADDWWSSFEGEHWSGVSGPFEDCEDGLAKVAPGAGLRTTPEQAAAVGLQSYYYCPPGEFNVQNVYYGTRAEQESTSVFANVAYSMDEKWSVSAGLRYIEDEKFQPAEGQAGFFCSGWVGPGPLCSGYSMAGHDIPHTWRAVVGQFTLEHTLSNDNLLYGRISTGHQSGVFQREENGQSFNQPYSDEATMLNWEVGSKGFLMDGRLQYAVGAFLMQYDDMQIEGFQEGPGGSVGEFSETPIQEFAGNISDTWVAGVEIEYAYAFSDQARVMGFYAYQDSEIGDHVAVVSGDPDAAWDLHTHRNSDTGEMQQSSYQLPVDQTGNQLPNQPKHKFAATFMYDQPLGGGGMLTYAGTYSFIASAYPTIANIDMYKLPSYDRLDLSVGWSNAKDTLSMQLFVDNVMDEIGLNEFLINNGLGDSMSNMAIGYPTNHRQFGLRMRYTPSL